MDAPSHFTTRRGFIAASGFGGLGLYGLWAAYGAAPTPLALLGLGEHTEGAAPGAVAGADHSAHGAAPEAAPAAAPAPEGAHAAHGGAAPSGPSPEEFTRRTQEFAQTFALPDGRIYPRAQAASMAMGAAMAGHGGASSTEGAANAPHAGHALASAPVPQATAADPHAAHTPPGAAATPHAAAPAAPGRDEPIDVYMTAGQWYYFPASLKLDVGQAYRFRMMAVDVPHGASISLGDGSRMMRLPNGRVTEVALTFPRKGTFFMLCTLYCGEGHSLMQARIDVE